MPPKKSVQLSGVVVAQTELCSIDAERGILRYRGYDIADLAEHATFEEVVYLLHHGELPTAAEVTLAHVGDPGLTLEDVERASRESLLYRLD